MRAARGAARIAAGVIFLAFGIGKFTNHRAEVDSFESYGLPSPDAFVYAIGAIEVIGGLLLVLGLASRLAALVLAGNMVGAIIVSGIQEGEPISLTLAAQPEKLPAGHGTPEYRSMTGPAGGGTREKNSTGTTVPGKSLAKGSWSKRAGSVATVSAPAQRLASRAKVEMQTRSSASIGTHQARASRRACCTSGSS
jgi:uncharacterized membrane protein YphA (DoxX/SURF4 family)